MIPVTRPSGLKPKVIIGIIAYNSAKYIAETLDSILCQKTNFPFEIHVSDNASTDDTPNILKKYKQQYIEKIQIMLCKNNEGAAVNGYRVLSGIESEYFSHMCSDDLWVGEHRLQKQVDFLDSHPEYMICSGNTQLLIDGKPGRFILPPEYMGITYTFADYFRKPALFHMSGILLRNKLYRNGVPRSPHFDQPTFTGGSGGEDFFRLIHLELGPMYVLPELVSYYRINPEGAWGSLSELERLISSVDCYTRIIMHYYGRYQELQNDIRNYVKPWYKKLWQKLVNEQYIYPEWRLNRKNTERLAKIMQNMVTVNEADTWFEVNS